MEWTRPQVRREEINLTRRCFPTTCVGSADHFDFEEDAYRETSCTIHTFDCTAKGTGLPENLKDRIHFHKICMGNPKDNVRSSGFDLLVPLSLSLSALFFIFDP